jgi:uncharacterized membrane protein
VVEIIFLLLCWHAVADYALQSTDMVYLKNPCSDDSNKISQRGPWWWTMTAHCLINALGVAIIANILYSFVEFITHFIADTLKCKGKINANTDQAIHILTKLFIGIHYSYLLG